jgi:transcriptional regulator with XRE-family HTH domain
VEAATSIPIRERREALGLSRQTLAGAAECSIAMLVLLERGYTPLESPVRERIEDTLTVLEQAA